MTLSSNHYPDSRPAELITDGEIPKGDAGKCIHTSMDWGWARVDMGTSQVIYWVAMVAHSSGTSSKIALL